MTTNTLENTISTPALFVRDPDGIRVKMDDEVALMGAGSIVVRIDAGRPGEYVPIFLTAEAADDLARKIAKARAS